MNRSLFTWLSLFAALLSFARTSLAQDSLSIGAGTANFGIREMRATRPNEGRVDVSVRTGGTLNVRPLNLQDRCVGWVTREPDLILRVLAPVPALRVWVESARDTTLVVNTHDGRWRCDDDSAGNGNPQVLIDEAGVGQYDIWVGSYARGVAVQGVLHVEPVAFANPANGTIATVGTIDLPRDFAPETRSINIPSHAAGRLDARWVASGCAGYITAAPDVILHVGEGVPMLRFTAPQVDRDAFLVVRTPDRQWRCNAAARPNTIESPVAGNYHVWIAQRIPYARYIYPQRIPDGGYTDGRVETPAVPETMPAARIDVTRTPLLLTGGATGALATQEIAPGFAPDPLVTTVADRAPGTIRAEELGTPGCVGFVSRQPDIVLRVTSTLSLLRVFATSTTDTTLVIHSPAGWRCRDDMFGFNPGVDFTDAQPGQYEIWLGSYVENQRHAGSISITANPNQRPVDPNQPTTPGASTTGAAPSTTNIGLPAAPPSGRIAPVPGSAAGASTTSTSTSTTTTTTTTTNTQVPAAESPVQNVRAGLGRRGRVPRIRR